MQSTVSARLVRLRKENELSQKDAAKALGVSQALLSHYENGIRECGLNFIRKASEFYNVSADYLLGLSDRRFRVDALFETSDIPQDTEIRPATLLRASSLLLEKISSFEGTKMNNAQTIYLMTLYKMYLCAVKMGVFPPSEFSGSDVLPYISVGIEGYATSVLMSGEKVCETPEEVPECIKTVVNAGTQLIREIYK